MLLVNIKIRAFRTCKAFTRWHYYKAIYFEFNLIIYIYIYSRSATIIRFKCIKTQYIFIKMTSFDEVVIMLHKFDSNSEHTFFYPQVIFGSLLKIVSCDNRLIIKEHLLLDSKHLYLVVCQ